MLTVFKLPKVNKSIFRYQTKSGEWEGKPCEQGVSAERTGCIPKRPDGSVPETKLEPPKVESKKPTPGSPESISVERVEDIVDRMANKYGVVPTNDPGEKGPYWDYRNKMKQAYMQELGRELTPTEMLNIQNAANNGFDKFSGTVSTKLDRPHFEPHVIKTWTGGDPKGELAVDDYPKEWGLIPGTFVAYRGGPVGSPRGTFFAPDKASANSYARLHGEQTAKTYKVTVKNPKIWENYIDGLAEVTGKTKGEILRSRDSSKNLINWWQAADKKLAVWAKKHKYDAIIFTQPADPCTREMNFIGDKSNIEAIA